MPSPPEAPQTRAVGGADTSAELLSLTDAFLFFRRNFLLVVGTAGVFAVGTFVGLTLLFPPAYQATATLIISPPSFSSTLKPPPMTVQAYQRLLESDKVLAQTQERLVTKGVLELTAPLRVGEEIESQIFVSRRAEETALAPIIEAKARSESPKNSAVIANSWADVFLDHVAEQNRNRTGAAIDFIDKQFSREEKELHDLEELEVRTQNEFQKTIDQAISRWDRTLSNTAMEWDRQLVAYEKETEDLLTAHKIDTRASIESAALERASEIGWIASRNAEADGLESFEHVDEAIFRIISLRIQLAQTPQFHNLEKAISDEAIWQTIVLSQTPLLKFQEAAGVGFLSQPMLTQEINPVYSDLVLKLAETELEVKDLSPEEREEFRQFTAELEKVQRLRRAALTKLMAERAMGLEEKRRTKSLNLMDLTRSKEEAVDALRRQREMRLAQVRRDVGSQSTHLDRLAKVHSQTEMVRAEQSLSNIALSSRAVAPAEPLPRRRLVKSVLGAVFGMLMGIFLALMKDVV